MSDKGVEGWTPFFLVKSNLFYFINHTIYNKLKEGSLYVVNFLFNGQGVNEIY